MSETKYKCVDILSAAGFEDSSCFDLISQDQLSKSKLQASYESRFMTALSILLSNRKDETVIDKNLINRVTSMIDQMLNKQVSEILAHPDFRKLETSWRSVQEVANSVNFQNTQLSIMDVEKDELAEDFENNSVDVSGSDFFKKIYVAEYDQFGGEPYGALIGLYDFDKSQEDIEWLTVMGKVAEASHAPFIAAVSPKLFGCETYNDLSDIKDVDGLMAHPRFGRWNVFRKTRAAGYIGLTLPNFMLRAPYDPVNNPAGKGPLSDFKEEVSLATPDQNCLWGNASVLFAKNLARSFETTGWCQSICGPTSGGKLEGLPIYNFNERDSNAFVLPVNLLIPDHKEYSLAKAGFIGLVYEKKTSNACFFSAQSLKVSEEFEDPNDSENSQLITKLPYTFSACKIAHYVKCMARDEIGSESDETIIANKLNTWISKYITTLPNPDTLTVSYYPFKAASIEVSKSHGMAGWYNCSIEVLPHVKFEGMDVAIKLDTRLA
ncbi:type VI secretion system contractile sheath large subunit [Francisella sp. 19X1-34]|uniref:type VI secretion system contractile sheath large subunit n=1 Tax=Francisella sp. 19X1-34 TaxID=3087177 RepID=UPI002E35CF3B|nr:type VI secretion system contractile sheath large subunit [Francisella sp. 19X1-34]MED7788103.1 type VI secretion system contractile sheath large subunit [Francisella sp. 19X1-34]